MARTLRPDRRRTASRSAISGDQDAARRPRSTLGLVSADHLTGQHLGHYLVGEAIGHGGMSVVYRAVDERLERSVALKVMSEKLSTDPEFQARFTEEAKAASAIDHLNVVPLYDFGQADGRLFIAMRLVDGTDLARELTAGPMPPRRALNLLTQVGAALDVLHERGLVHLDVKPANVLITRTESVGREHVYLADFGLTRRGIGGHRTVSGDFLGSPTYASPEHIRGEDVGPYSDEYALTCMLFSALAGRAPFVGDVRAVITGHLSGVLPSLSAESDLPPSIDQVIARGMAADPAMRYPTSAGLLKAARRALASTSVRRTPEPAVARPAPEQVAQQAAPERVAEPAAQRSAPVRGAPERVADRPTPGRARHRKGHSSTPTAGPGRATPCRKWLAALTVLIVLAGLLVFLLTRDSAARDAPVVLPLSIDTGPGPPFLDGAGPRRPAGPACTRHPGVPV